MTNSDNTQTGKSKTMILAVIAIVIVLVASGLYFLLNGNNDESDEASGSENLTEINAPDDPASLSLIRTALKERSIGSENAPIVMEDFSSLTCPHCARFHLDILPQLKRNYVDNGQLRIVFKDFPLNLPALQASSISRCINNDTDYFAYIDRLFSTQSEWGTEINAQDALLQTLDGTGLSQEDATACLNSPTITTHILTVQNDAKNQFNIDSTPYFILNGGEAVIRGLRSYDSIAEEIDTLLDQAE